MPKRYTLHLGIVELHMCLPHWWELSKLIEPLRQSRTSVLKHRLKPEHYRQILYAYYVFDDKWEIPVLKYDPFDFLDPQRTSVTTPHAILLDPSALGLPWFSTVKGCLQGIYWREAEATGLELIQEVLEMRGAGAVIPEKLNTDDQSRKMRELVETSVAIVIYLYPHSDAARVRILTKSMMFLFLHDDVIEATNNVQGTTILEGWDTDIFGADELEGHSRNKIFLKFCREAITIDPILGLELVQSMVKFANYSRRHGSQPGKRYASWQDFVNFREQDIAYDLMINAVRFSAATLHEKADRPIFKWIENLYIRLCIYANDLYSYEKEVRESQEEGSVIHNSVRVIEELLSVPPASAKSILRTVFWDCERQLREEYERLVSLPEVNEAQKIYLRRLVESFVGNKLYSMSAYRYARLSGKLLEPPSEDCLLKDYV